MTKTVKALAEIFEKMSPEEAERHLRESEAGTPTAPTADEISEAIEKVFAMRSWDEEPTDQEYDEIIDALYEQFPGIDLTPELCEVVAETFKARLAGPRSG